MNSNVEIFNHLKHVDEYSDVLGVYDLKFKEFDYYLQVGDLSQVQGWVIHISVIFDEVIPMLHIIIPELVKDKISFRLVKDKMIARSIISGEFGYEQIGNILSLYPSESQLLDAAKRYVCLTTEFRSPKIPADVYLGGACYARYGGINPILYSDERGRVDKYIYDVNGELQKDMYSIPFLLHKGVDWPFGELASPIAPSKEIFLNQKYLVTKVLKDQAKGRIMKALRLNGFLIESCFVKEGRKNMSVDTIGRDMIDRLKWQFGLQAQLYPEFQVPKIFDFFEQNDSAYLVMQFVKGVSLRRVILSIYNGESWRSISNPSRIRLLKFISNVLNVIIELHKRGVVHRDVTYNNFLVKRNDELVMVDVELAYQLNNDLPCNAPFVLGTNGFMSPQQQLVQVPTVYEDVYAIGALMLSFFTNLPPSRFDVSNPMQVKSALALFVDNEKVSDLIISCLDFDFYQRPSLDFVRNNVIKFLDDGNFILVREPHVIDDQLFKKSINNWLLALNDLFVSKPDNIWYSNIIDNTSNEVSLNKLKAYYIGLHTGISGVMLLVAFASDLGYDVKDLRNVLDSNYEYLKTIVFDNIDTVISSFYFGTTGMVVALSATLDSCLIDQPDLIESVSNQCFKRPTRGKSLAEGSAGRGMALLGIRGSFKNEETVELIIADFIASQLPDGSWTLEGDGVRYSPFGFSYGISGILCFLLECYRKKNDVSLRASICKGLDFLRKKIRRSGRVDFSNSSNPLLWLDGGLIGAALCFVKGYDVLRDSSYKIHAQTVLNMYPKYMISDNFTLLYGVVGVGEVYLEAYRVFGEQEWYLRASWIANVLAHTSHKFDNGACFWLVDGEKLPTCDLMIGNGGIVYFLMRILDQKKTIPFPLFPRISYVDK